MPVYEVNDYEAVIQRIQRKAEALQIKMGECLTEEAVAAFEERCKVRLPKAYRLFLKNVGNGCAHMFEGCLVSSVCWPPAWI